MESRCVSIYLVQIGLGCKRQGCTDKRGEGAHVVRGLSKALGCLVSLNGTASVGSHLSPPCCLRCLLGFFLCEQSIPGPSLLGLTTALRVVVPYSRRRELHLDEEKNNSGCHSVL